MDLRTYSSERVGRTWTEADHIVLSGHLDRIDKLAHEVYNLAADAKRHASRQVREFQPGDRVACKYGKWGCDRIVDHLGPSLRDGIECLTAYFVGGGYWRADELVLVQPPEPDPNESAESREARAEINAHMGEVK